MTSSYLRIEERELEAGGLKLDRRTIDRDDRGDLLRELDTPFADVFRLQQRPRGRRRSRAWLETEEGTAPTEVPNDGAPSLKPKPRTHLRTCPRTCLAWAFAFLESGFVLTTGFKYLKQALSAARTFAMPTARKRCSWVGVRLKSPFRSGFGCGTPCARMQAANARPAS
jgi:hypothetical protein